MRRFFAKALYIKVRENQFEITDLTGEAGTRLFQPARPFTTSRLLIGEFSGAEDCLKAGIEQMCGKQRLRAKPAVLIQPLAKTEGGLSQVEDRVLREVALGAGACSVSVWVGEELSVAEAKKKIGSV